MRTITALALTLTTMATAAGTNSLPTPSIQLNLNVTPEAYADCVNKLGGLDSQCVAVLRNT